MLTLRVRREVVDYSALALRSFFVVMLVLTVRRAHSVQCSHPARRFAWAQYFHQSLLVCFHEQIFVVKLRHWLLSVFGRFSWDCALVLV